MKCELELFGNLLASPASRRNSRVTHARASPFIDLNLGVC